MKLKITGMLIILILSMISLCDFVYAQTRLINLSTRAFQDTTSQTGSPYNVTIGGFWINGTGNETVLIRGRGPSMSGAPFNVPGTLSNPYLQIYSGSTVIAQNDNWQSTDPLCGSPAISCGNASQITATTLDPCQPNPGQSMPPPGCAYESAILITLPPGGYTAILNASGGTGKGIGSVEMFEITPPDLVMSSGPLIGPNSAVTGTYYTVSSYTVCNNGTGNAGPFSVSFSLAGRTIGTQAVSGLTAGQCSSLGPTSPFLLDTSVNQSLPPGTYPLTAMADSGNSILESNEGNNTTTGTSVTVSLGPDLVIDSVSGPNTATVGSTVTLSYTVRNQGSGSTLHPFDVVICVRPTGKTTFLPPDQSIYSRIDLGYLDSGGTFTDTVQSSPLQSSGSYYFTATADATLPNSYGCGQGGSGKILENNEGNNTRAGNTINITP